MTTTPPGASDESGPEIARSAAFFDMHGTAVPAAAHVPLAAAAIRSGWMNPQTALGDVRTGVLYMLRGVGEERAEKVRSQVFSALAGRDRDEFLSLVADLAPTLADSVTTAMRRLLDEHMIAGRDRVLISASPTDLVARVAAALGLEGGVGTTPAVDANGRFTGGTDGPVCSGEGKAEILRRIAEQRGYDLGESYAYSDSITDLPMLESVGHPVAVNPDPALRALAEDRQWPILQTSRFQRITLTDPNAWLRISQRLLVASVAAIVSMGTRPVEYLGDVLLDDEDDDVALAG